VVKVGARPIEVSLPDEARIAGPNLLMRSPSYAGNPVPTTYISTNPRFPVAWPGSGAGGTQWPASTQSLPGGRF
jgi:hypothetical protein